MTDQFNTDALKAITGADQVQAHQKERDRAIARGIGFTASHYQHLVGQGLPGHLVEALTIQFHAAYFGALFNPVVSVQVVEGDE